MTIDTKNLRTLAESNTGRLQRERDTLAAEVAELRKRNHGWVKENCPGGWIDSLRKERGALVVELAALRMQEPLSELLVRVEEMREASYTFGEYSKEAVDVALSGVIEIIEAAIKEKK